MTVSEAHLWAACAQSEAAVFARNGLLSVLAHDLRGSLNTIHSWAHLLEAKFSAGQAGMQSALTGIGQGVKQQIRIIENGIEAVCAEAKWPLERELMILQPHLASVLAQHQTHFASERGVVFEVDWQLGNVPASVDATRIWQALWVILAYAIEASEPDAHIVLRAGVEQNTATVLASFKFSSAMWLDETVAHKFEHFVRVAAGQATTRGIPFALNLPAHVMALHAGQFERQHKEDGTVALALKWPVKPV